MAQMTLKFSRSPEWVTDRACNDIEANTQAKAKANRNGRNNSGTLVLTAATQERLEAAQRYLLSHYLYKLHFTT